MSAMQVYEKKGHGCYHMPPWSLHHQVIYNLDTNDREPDNYEIYVYKKKSTRQMSHITEYRWKEEDWLLN